MHLPHICPWVRMPTRPRGATQLRATSTVLTSFCSPGEPLVVSVARSLSSDFPMASIPHHPYSPELVALELLAKSVGLDDIRRAQVVEDGSELLLESDRRASGCPWQGWRY